MLKINFYPDSDIKDFSNAIKEYEEIWLRSNNKIVELWEKYTGLKFKESVINAIIYPGVSRSHPLSLRGKYEYKQKQFVLIHELGHRILAPYVPGGIEASSIQIHKLLYLALYDILEDFGGKELADSAVEWDSQLLHSGPSYKEAWDWALGFPTKEERNNKLREVISSGYGSLD